MSDINSLSTLGALAASNSVLDAVQWHEGMLLLPHHFQQADKRFQGMVHYHMKGAAPYHWGVQSYEIDPVLLAAGLLKLVSYEVLFPDGLLAVSFSDQDPYPELNLTEYTEALEQGPLLIQLTVSTLHENRFSSVEGNIIPDVNTGENPIQIPQLQPKVALFGGAQLPVNTVGVPLVLVEKYSNAYRLAPFVPPTLKVQSETPVHRMAISVAAEIRTKIAYLSNRLQSQSGTGVTSESEFILRSLNSAVVPFEALLYSQSLHPFSLYLALCSLAGCVSSIYPRHIPPLFRPYNHNDLLTTFKQVEEYIHQTLKEIQEGYEVVPFERENRFYSLDISNYDHLSHLIVGASLPEAMNEDEMKEWVKGCIIATEDLAAQARDRRILGCTRQFIQGDTEMGLLPTQGVVMFSVDLDSRMIDFEQKLKVFNISDTEEKRPFELVLYVPKH